LIYWICLIYLIAPRIPPGQSECSENPIEICWAVHAMAWNEGCRNSLRGFAARCWLRVAGCWLLAAGYWLMVDGCWLLGCS